MPDLTEQLAAYAARAADEVEPVRAADVVVEEAVTATDAPVVELEPARKRRPRVGVWLGAAACVAAVALVAGMLVIRDDETSDVATEPPTGETFGYGPGWHQLDPGPLMPRYGASVTWTDEELIVLGGSDHHDGAAYNPTTRAWRTIADPPWTGDGGVEAVWTGDELFVLGHPGPDARTAGQPVAAYDPASDTWRVLPNLPLLTLTDVRGELIWTGTEVLRVIWYSPSPDSVEITAYSEETGTWTELPAAPASLFSTDDDAGNRYGAAWTGTDLVFAAFGRPTYVFDPDARAWSTAASAPAGRGAEASATWDGSALRLVDYQGNAASFDPASETWTEEEAPGESNHFCGLYGAPVVVAAGGSVVVDLCGSLVASTPDGGWETIDSTDYYENQLTLEPAGDTILAWSSTNEPMNWPAEDPNRPPSDQWFRIWVPESAATTPPAPPPPSTPDDSATFGYAPGWHELDAGPLSPRSGASLTWTGEELIVLGGERHRDGAAYNPTTRTWRAIADPPWAGRLSGGDGVVEAVWAGDQLIAIGPPDPLANQAALPVAAYDPSADSWTELAPWPIRSSIAEPRPTLAWTGHEVIRLDSLDIYRPSTDEWSEIPLPDGGFAATEPGTVSDTYTAALSGRRVVVTAFGRQAYAYDLDAEEWTLSEEAAPVSLGGSPTIIAAEGTGDLEVRVDMLDTMWMVDWGGAAARLDARTLAWEDLSRVDVDASICKPAGVAMTGAVVVNMCTGLFTADGERGWSEIDGGDGTCCYPTIVSTGATLLQWTSNDDTENDSDEPHAWFRIWVPESAAIGTPEGVEEVPTPGTIPIPADTGDGPSSPEQTTSQTTTGTPSPTTSPVGTDGALPGIEAYEWEWYGLTTEAAVAKVEAEGREWRIGREDGAEYHFRDSGLERRVTFQIDDGLVTYASVEAEPGAAATSEGAIDPEDLPYVGLALVDARDRARQRGEGMCVVGLDCGSDESPGDLAFTVDDVASDKPTVIAVNQAVD